jgi:hypothetical protein
MIFIFLKRVEISLRSTFSNWIIYDSGIRSRHSLAILKDLEINFRAKVLSTFIASS